MQILEVLQLCLSSHTVNALQLNLDSGDWNLLPQCLDSQLGMLSDDVLTWVSKF